MKKTEGGITTYSFFPSYEEEYAAGATDPVVAKYYFADGRRIAQNREDAGLLFFHVDHLGSSSVMSDQSGKAVTEIRYESYGSDNAEAGVTDTFNSDTDISGDPSGEVLTIKARKSIELDVGVVANGTVDSNIEFVSGGDHPEGGGEDSPGLEGELPDRRGAGERSRGAGEASVHGEGEG